jgi:hypothetical protein
MIFIVSPFLLRNKFNGMVLWPFVILKDSKLKNDLIFLNHERIHLKQQAEFLLIFFYLWYGLEFLFRILQYKNKYKAYRNISFEREAYAHEKDLDYLKKRPFCKFFTYL